MEIRDSLSFKMRASDHRRAAEAERSAKTRRSNRLSTLSLRPAVLTDYVPPILCGPPRLCASAVVTRSPGIHGSFYQPSPLLHFALAILHFAVMSCPFQCQLRILERGSIEGFPQICADFKTADPDRHRDDKRRLDCRTFSVFPRPWPLKGNN